MRQLLAKWPRPLVLPGAGAPAGLACSGGSRFIAANPVTAMLCTGLTGLLLSGVQGKEETPCNT